MPLTKPSKKPKKWFSLRVVKRELWPQSCIKENILKDRSVRKQIIGNNNNPFINNKKGEFIISWTINQKEIMGNIVEKIW